MNLTKAQLDAMLAHARGQPGPIGPSGDQGPPGKRGPPGVAGAANRDILVQAVTSAGTITPAFGWDVITISGQTMPLLVGAPVNTPSDGWGWVMRIKDDGTARAITWDSIYRAIGCTLPSTTTAGKLLYIPMVYNLDDSKVDVFLPSEEL